MILCGKGVGVFNAMNNGRDSHRLTIVDNNDKPYGAIIDVFYSNSRHLHSSYSTFGNLTFENHNFETEGLLFVCRDVKSIYEPIVKLVMNES